MTPYSWHAALPNWYWEPCSEILSLLLSSVLQYQWHIAGPNIHFCRNFIAGYLSGSSELKAPSAFNLVKAGCYWVCSSHILWCQLCHATSSDQVSEASPQPRHGEVQPVQRARKSLKHFLQFFGICRLFNLILFVMPWRAISLSAMISWKFPACPENATVWFSKCARICMQL